LDELLELLLRKARLLASQMSAFLQLSLLILARTFLLREPDPLGFSPRMLDFRQLILPAPFNLELAKLCERAQYRIFVRIEHKIRSSWFAPFGGSAPLPSCD
jgi:hypothetical protein